VCPVDGEHPKVIDFTCVQGKQDNGQRAAFTNVTDNKARARELRKEETCSEREPEEEGTRVLAAGELRER